VTIRNFGLGTKLLCVCLAFGLPIIVMSVLMAQAKLGEIRFAEKELAGDAFQRPLERVLEHVGRHRRLHARSLHEKGLAEQMVTEEHAVLAALADLEVQNQKHGTELQFTPDGLEIRGRRQFTVSELVGLWQRLRSELSTAETSNAEKLYLDIAAHVRTMITHAGDTSNLILDPDLDSYYLMDATLLALPQIEGRIQQIAATLASAGRSDQDSERRQLGILAALLKQSDWDRIAASIHTAFNEDPNFHGPSPSLESTLSPHLEACELQLGLVLASLEQLASGARRDLDSGRFLAELDGLDAAIYALHHAAFDEEDRLIARRIDDFERSLHLGFALAAASVLVSALLAFALSSHIMRRLQRLAVATRAFASGDLEARVGDAGSDELGQLAQSFDVMTSRIGGLTAEVRRRALELEQINGNLEALVDERTQELRKRNHAFKLILDNARDGMLTVDLAGVMGSERSVAMDQWFGQPAPSTTLGAYLAPDDATLAAQFALGLEQIESAFLPLELTLDQMPKSMKSGKRHFRLSYQPISENGVISRLLVIVADVTSEVAGRQAAELQEDVLRMFQACQRDRPGFLNFFVESRDLMKKISGPCSPVELRRAIHTMKGNSALFGVLGISRLCHEVENHLSENDGNILPSDIASIEEVWSELSAAVTRVAGDDKFGTLEVADAEYAGILDAIANGRPRREILEAISGWKLEPAERRLQRLGDQACHLARRLGKDVRISVAAHGLRMCAETWSPVWSALSHAIRNSVDHGIEPARERIERGLLPEGTIRLEVRKAPGRLIIEVADDGRGIQWAVLAKKAKAASMPHETHADLLQALFADGISSRDNVSDTSGRGVGMGALRDACRQLGGSVTVESPPRGGTLLRCTFPDEAIGGRVSARAASRPIVESLPPVGAK
jgi:HAMP domain-containing protein/HPt (histidine-containing phosphotransfer) domain-containing protein